MSKGLEALVSLELNACQTSDQKEWAYNIIEKELKALEIIRNMRILSPYETCGGKYWLETMADAIGMTKENYDLLKEVLRDE